MESPFKVFVVEDDIWYANFLAQHIQNRHPDFEVLRFENAADCLENVERLRPDIITLDFRLPDMDGWEASRKILEAIPGQKIVVISGQEDIKTAIGLLKEGIYDYIVKDDDTKDRLFKIIDNALENRRLTRENERLKKQLSDSFNPIGSIIGSSSEMVEIRSLIERASQSNINVCITGETGTGKEMAARSIHFNGNQSDGQFIPVNLSLLSNEKGEIELFGCEKGVSPEYPNGRIGKFEEANGGTLFLDEVTSLSFSYQVKLLRILQDKEIQRVGASHSIPLNVRFIFSSNKNLGEEVGKGNLREDLYYRMLGLSIELPPLRDRGNDVLLLAEHFLHDYCRKNGMQVKFFSPDAEFKIKRYDFPGNVRELKAMVELAAVVSTKDLIDDRDIIIHKVERNTEGFLSVERSLETYNRLIIHHFLDKYNQKVLLVADKLSISKSTIYNMLKAERDERRLKNRV
jgi:two-component system, NtrC family, response regulator AtoC